MEQALKESHTVSEALHSTIAVVSDQQRDLQQDLEHIRSSFARSLQMLAEDLSHPALTPLRRSGKSLHLSLHDLRELHQKLMPATVVGAGELRSFQVQIAGASYTPPDASLVPDLLDKLLVDWNENADSLTSAPRRQQIHHLTKFHHELLLVHPFTDGNGALARTLLSMQLRILTGNTRSVVFGDRKRYVEAMQAADAGDLAPLEQLISELAED